MVFIHYIRILSSVTMPTCDVLLRHFRKMLLYTQGYAVAYSHLLSTLGNSLCLFLSFSCHLFIPTIFVENVYISNSCTFYGA